MRLYISIFFFLFFRAYSQIPTLGLEGYWPFHGNANDSSGYFNDGIVNGATLTYDRFGNCNEAYSFNGINADIVIPNSSNVDMDNFTDFTISIWIKTHINNANSVVLSKNSFGSWSGYQFFANISGSGYCNMPNHVSFYTASGGGQDACTNNSIDTNWHHVVGVYKSNINQNYIYLDAILQSDVGQRSGALSTAADLVLGSNTVNSEYFMGNLDAIRIYKRALTSQEIVQLYNEASSAIAIGTSNFLRDTTVCADSINLNAGAANSYTWSTGSHTQSINVSNSGIFWATIENSNGCRQTDTAHVTITSIDNFLIPNVFTPNGDGANDFFEFKTTNIIVDDFRVYNRWGKLVYSIAKSAVKWDGKQANGMIDDGTYYWVASFNNSCNNTQAQQKGFISIFK